MSVFSRSCLAVTLAAATITPLTACSADARKSRAPEVLAAAVKAGLVIEKKFKAVPGLDGWVIKDSSGQMSVVYTTVDGKYLVSGLLLDAEGRNLTREFSEQHIPKPDYAKFWDSLEKSAWVATGETGNPKSVIYAFMDPNCIFCSLAAKALVPYENAGLQVRWIPVGMLTQDSAGKAAAILESSNPGKTLHDHELNYKGAGDTLRAIATPKPETDSKLKSNLELMLAMGFNGTPAIVYKDAKGNVMVQGGMPRMSDLPLITGLPEQVQTDPGLERFK